MHQKIFNKRKIIWKFKKYIITLGLPDTFGYIIFFYILSNKLKCFECEKQLTLNPLGCGVNYNKTWLVITKVSCFTLDLKLITENILQSLVVLWSIHEHISHIKKMFLYHQIIGSYLFITSYESLKLNFYKVY